MVSRRRLISSLVVALAVSLPGTRPADAVVHYRPPVDAPVVDGFRLPDGPFGAGNRGLEYATVPGTPVRAIGDGLVVFAGPVAGNRAVTVLHPDGLRSSYSYLAEIQVTTGDRLTIGQGIGTAGERLHLGVRSGGTYLDPSALFTASGVHLVPVDAGSVGPWSRGERPTGQDPVGGAVWTWLTGDG